MERITTAGTMIIEHDAERWRLLSNGQTGDAGNFPLFEVINGEPIRYTSDFAAPRKLPMQGTGLPGTLDPHQIARVVVGWAQKDAAWHLGLMLDAALTAERGSRWCPLASWRNPNPLEFQEVATHAGQSLAQKLGCSFAAVPPKPVTYEGMTAPVDTAEVRQAIAQPDLPITVELWTLERIDRKRLAFVLSPSWARARLRRVMTYIPLTGAFFILTVSTFTSGIALPRPEILSYLGIASTIVMILAIIVTLSNVSRQPKRVVFDGTEQVVLWMRGESVIREIRYGHLAEVVVSNVVSKVGRRADRETRQVKYSELNLLVRPDTQRDPLFIRLLSQGRVEESIPVTDDPFDQETVVPLTVFNARTKLQSIALAISETMGVPATYDKRLS